MELSVVILNWNAGEDTLGCVRALASWKQLVPAVWVVDNASSDDSPEMIAREAPSVRLIRNPSNEGFGGGNNRGIEAALQTSDAPILLLNNDAQLSEAAAAQMLDTLQAHPEVGFVGPLLYSEDEPPRLLSAGGRNPIRHHASHLTQLPTAAPVRTVEYVPGTVLLIRAAVFREIGLLKEDYFFTMEVAELCMRAARRGYRSVVDCRARATHAVEARPSWLRQTLYAYYIIRNRFLLIRDSAARPRLLYQAGWALYSLVLALKIRLSGKPHAARAVLMGLSDGLRGRFGGQNERVLAQCQPEVA